MVDTVEARLAARRRAMKKRYTALKRQHANDPAAQAEALVQIAINEAQWMLKQGVSPDACRMAIRGDDRRVVCYTTDPDAMERYRSYVARWCPASL
jgi:hypothetical protein